MEANERPSRRRPFVFVLAIEKCKIYGKTRLFPILGVSEDA